MQSITGIISPENHIKNTLLTFTNLIFICAILSQIIAILNNVESTVKEPISKTLNSAIANAVNNYELEADKLVVSEIYVNPGATLKRMRARAKGSGNRILKRTSHIHIKVAVAE